MKILTTLLFLSIYSSIWAQTDTEVYLADLNRKDGKILLSNIKNISNNEGYDNQPSFYDDHTIIYAATRNGQTDIATYDLNTGITTWITNTPNGSEYSPLRIPYTADISAVRLDKNGLQRLYTYDISNGSSKEILKDVKVGYHVWFSDTMLFTSVLVANRMDLTLNNLTDFSATLIQKNVGRSLHNIPNSNLISYIDKNGEFPLIKSYDLAKGASKEINRMLPEKEDTAWLSDGSLIIPNGNAILKLLPNTDTDWNTLHRFEEKAINGISRMTISPDGKHMAMVSNASAAIVVQRQVEAFNAENIDAFAACYTENVVVANFPTDTLYTGNSTLKSGYKRFFENNPKTTVEVVKRIQIGDIVIDEEIVTRSGRTNHQAAIYRIVNGKIASMTFIHEKTPIPGVEEVVKQQLVGYNTRDIDAFAATYSEDIKIFNFPQQPLTEGQENLRKGYQGFFENTPDLNCEIKNRMVIGNKVIDEEYLTMNGSDFSAVAIYEVENGKIITVTFVK